MNKTVVGISLFLPLLILISLANAQKVNLTGTWKGTYYNKSLGKQGKITVKLEQNGENIKGYFKSGLPFLCRGPIKGSLSKSTLGREEVWLDERERERFNAKIRCIVHLGRTIHLENGIIDINYDYKSNQTIGEINGSYWVGMLVKQKGEFTITKSMQITEGREESGTGNNDSKLSQSQKEQRLDTQHQDFGRDSKDKLAQGQQNEISDMEKMDSKSTSDRQSTREGQGETQDMGGAELASSKEKESGAGTDGTEQTSQKGQEGWGAGNDADEKLRLAEEIKNLKATYAAWQQADAEFREWRKQDKTDESESREFAGFVAELKHKVIVSCKVVRMLGGDANQHCVDCIRFENETESDTSGVLPNITREQTREEKAALLIKQFEGIGSDYDGMILDQQTRIRNGQVISQSHGDWASDSDDISGINKTAGGGVLADGALEESMSESEPIEQGYELGAGPGVKKQGKIPDFKTEDVGDGSDDDVVARQLREAAESETDQLLKEELWNEYKKYKKSSN
jgi:hypothetical protein